MPTRPRDRKRTLYLLLTLALIMAFTIGVAVLLRRG